MMNVGGERECVCVCAVTEVFSIALERMEVIIGLVKVCYRERVSYVMVSHMSSEMLRGIVGC